MTAPYDDAWAWLNNTVSGTSSPLSFDNVSPSDLDSTLGPLASLGGFELTTPVADLATSPDVLLLGQENQGHPSEAELQRLCDEFLCEPDALPYGAVSSAADACAPLPDFSADLVPPLMVNTMGYADNFADDFSMHAFPSLDMYDDTAISLEQLGLPAMQPDLPVSMSIPVSVSNMVSGGVPPPAMDMATTVPMAPSMAPPIAPSMAPSIAPPMASFMAFHQPAHSLPLTPVVPSSTPLPAMSPAMFASVSPHTCDEDDMDDGSAAGSPGTAGAGGRAGSATGSDSYRCRACKRSYPSASRLRKHERTHSRPFGCSFCEKTHAAKKDLDRHMWTKHPEDAERLRIPSPLRLCPVTGCGYEGRQDNLTRHVRDRHPGHGV